MQSPVFTLESRKRPKAFVRQLAKAVLTNKQKKAGQRSKQRLLSDSCRTYCSAWLSGTKSKLAIMTRPNEYPQEQELDERHKEFESCCFSFVVCYFVLAGKGSQRKAISTLGHTSPSVCVVEEKLILLVLLL